MIFNKSYLTTFSKNKPYLALASKGKILDSKFTFTSEISLYDYSLDKHYPALQTDSEYCKLVWCENDNMQILATGHTNGSISLYEPDTNSSFKHIKTFEGLTGKVMGIDYNPSKNVIAAGSANGNIIFWNLDKIDQQYKCDIPITENITSLAWNNKVSKILCVGTECGKIIVLDIRLKRIAMTLQYPDIKIINNIRWHSKSSTSLFASTNLNCLSCFKLDSNSRTNVGDFDSSPVNFSTVNKDTVARYTDGKIDYIDIDSLNVRESIKIENAFDVSFSPRDPIYCCSYISGTTEIFSTSVSSITVSNPNVQLNNCVVGSEILTIKSDKFEIQSSETVESKLLDTLYDRSGFKFNSEARKLLGDMFLENKDLFKNYKSPVENSGISFNLDDKLIKLLIKNEEIKEEDRNLLEGRSISLEFFFNIVIKKTPTVESDPINFLLSLIVRKDYDQLWKTVSSEQWPIMIAILLYSDLSDDQVINRIREIESELKLPILKLLLNEPTDFYNSADSVTDLPKTVFEVIPFFMKYGGEIINLKKLNLKYDNPLLNEYFWYAKNHGMYNDLKDLCFENDVIKIYINSKSQDQSSLQRQGSKVEKEVSKISLKQPVPKIQTKPLPEVLAHTEVKDPALSRPPLYSSSANKSVTSFSTKPVPKPASKDLAPPSFSTKPTIPKKSLYSGVLNRSATNFSTRPESSVPTYGQQSPSIVHPSSNVLPSINPSSSFNPSPSIPAPNTASRAPIIPHPVNRSAPVPNNTVAEPTPQSNLDVLTLSKSLEEVFDSLKQTASKKNNLIIANKIKDAVRRFSVFQQIDKNELPAVLLVKIDEILNILNDDKDRTLVKQKVRSVIDECIDMRMCQSDIWMPAIAILVQLVY